MESPIPLATNQDLGRYLQSLDSVRFAESDSKACIIQARAELLASLLFGQTVPIGEHQFLDSDGFITSAVDLIRSLNSIDNPKDRRKVESIFPFRVGIRAEFSTIDNLIAKKLGDVNYKLSRWQRLDKMHEVRNEIKKKYEKGNFKFENLFDMVPVEEQEAVEELKLVRDRFRGGEKGQILTLYNKPTVIIAGQIGLLHRGLEEIISWNDSDLHHRVELQEELRKKGYEPKDEFDPDLIKPAVELIERLRALHNAGISFENRSNVRRNQESRNVIPESNKFDAILEIYDSLYNTSIAKAVESHSESVSSARNIQDNIYLRAALALTTLAVNRITSRKSEHTRQSTGLGKFQWMHNTNFGVLKASKEELVLAQMPWQVVWQAYLDPNWQKSLSRLNNAFVEWDKLMEKPTRSPDEFMGAEHKLDDAISRHTENMTKLLSGSILQLHKDSKTGDIVFDLASTIGPAVIIGAEFVMSRLGFTLPAGTYTWTATTIPVVGMLTKYSFPYSKAWRTNGRIRKMFQKIYNPTD